MNNISRSAPFVLAAYPVHLGLGATAVPQPKFTGEMDWYMQYGQRHADDGEEGRLVSMHTFTEPWDSWEMHPAGSELVVVTAGSVRLIQEVDGTEVVTPLDTGDAAINEPGVWHTMDTDQSATVLFITAGAGTQNRSRNGLRQ